VTTLAGTAGMAGSSDGIGAAARFMGPIGVALDGAGNLFVADSAALTIRKVVVSSGEVTTVAGTAGMGGSSDGIGAAARFASPRGVAVDGAGNLYIADSSNGTIRSLRLADSSVTTLVGLQGQAGVKLGVLPARLNLPIAVTALPSGGMIILDGIESAILVVR